MRSKFEHTAYITYAVCICIALVFIVYICNNLKNDVYFSRITNDYVTLTPESFTTTEGSDCPLGVYNTASFKIDTSCLEDSHLVFFTIHEAVEIFIDDELVFSLQPDKSNAFSKTTGPNWNNILLSPSDSGKLLKVVLVPLYENRIGYCPEFYLGSELKIYTNLVIPNMLVFFIGLAAIVAGIVCIFFALISLRNRHIASNLLMLGVFSLFIGIWKISDMDTTALLFPASITLSYVTYLCLMLLVIPFILFIKEVFTDNRNILWYIPCIANVVVFAAMLILQITGIADLRQTLWMVHLVMLCVIPIVFIMFHKELKNNGWSRKLKLTFLCMALCLIGLLADVITYYLSGSSYVSALGMSVFLIYIVVFAISSFNNARQLMAAGRQAKHYEEIAYHDQLTGLYNRTAYAEYIGKKDFNPEGCIIVMFELNNLKSCNDTYGHEKGDVYITASAKLIEETFGQLGNCYRMGGDEFCTIMYEVSLEQCAECAHKLSESVDTYNRTHSNDFSVHIACGYTMYDSEHDYDIGDTLRRADRMMYNRKFEMKNQASAATIQ